MVQTPVPSELACLVLAGGQSRRFGSEKAMARLHGRTLLEWTASRLAQTGGVLAVSAKKNSETEISSNERHWPVLHDADELPRGALDGVCAGLAWAHVIGKSWLVTLPCDVPLLPEDYFARLFAAAGAHGAYAQSPHGIESLCAIWPVSALSFLQVAAKHPDQPALHQCLKDLGAKAVTFDADFFNVNTQEDLRALEATTRVESNHLVQK